MQKKLFWRYARNRVRARCMVMGRGKGKVRVPNGKFVIYSAFGI